MKYDIESAFDLNRYLVVDVETDALEDPTQIHFIVCLDQDDKEYVFEKPDRSIVARMAFLRLLSDYPTIVGHNYLAYDDRCLHRLVDGYDLPHHKILDTLVVSRLLNYNLKGGHSLDALGAKLGIKKVGTDITDWSKPTPYMLERCKSDVQINKALITKRFWKYLTDQRWWSPLRLEHHIQWVCERMTDNGFTFDYEAALELKKDLETWLSPIDAALASAFPPRPAAVREVNPRLTKHGSFNLNDFKWYDGDDLSVFNGGPFTIVEYVPFNPGSPRQIVERLNEAGWKPTEKTKGHTEALKSRTTPPEKMEEYRRYGWKVNETNLQTLPDSAPAAAKDIAKRIIFNSRLSDVDEWLALAKRQSDGTYKIHGRFNGIGAWTHRLSHSKPNLANIPVAKRSGKDSEFETLVGDINDRMRALFKPSPGKRIVGTDADGLQMRVFAHYVNDPELTDGLVRGSKEDKTDIHSVHQRKLGDDCKSRDSAKTFIYAWLLGAGNAKVAEILETTVTRAKTAVAGFIESYPGLAELKRSQIPSDAARGYFEGMDGRLVAQDSEHLMLAGYLQNGEAIIMKRACLKWMEKLDDLGIEYGMLTWPHDEWQTEIADDDEVCKTVQQIQIQAIRDVAVDLNLNCPMEGSSDWGYSWKDTH